MEPKVQKKEFKVIDWWWVIIIALALYWIFSSSSNDEYSSCVDDCVYDINSCASDSMVFTKNSFYPYNSKGYIPELDYEICQSELESCVLDCEP